MAPQENQHKVIDYEFTSGQQRLPVEGVQSLYRFPKPERNDMIEIPTPTRADTVIELSID